jgi:hypothetical protein
VSKLKPDIGYSVWCERLDTGSVAQGYYRKFFAVLTVASKFKTHHPLNEIGCSDEKYGCLTSQGKNSKVRRTWSVGEGNLGKK